MLLACTTIVQEKQNALIQNNRLSHHLGIKDGIFRYKHDFLGNFQQAQSHSGIKVLRQITKFYPSLECIQFDEKHLPRPPHLPCTLHIRGMGGLRFVVDKNEQLVTLHGSCNFAVFLTTFIPDCRISK